MPDRRLTQEPVEVAEQGTADPRRLTQIAVEVAYQSALHRLTQGVVEGGVQVTGASLLRRWTQIVVEVPITQPVQPYAVPEYLEHPEWSPAFLAKAIETDATVYASLYGIHSAVIVLGRRGNWTSIRRK